jgi:hypothetical protein
MKLFAKRTKKLASSSNDAAAERTVFQSDPIVDALLQQDPSTWNAKQRRMIKRYQDRKQESPEVSKTSPQKKEETAEQPQEPSKKEEKAGEERGEEQDSDNADSESEDSSDEEDEVEEGEATKQQENEQVSKPDSSVVAKDAAMDAAEDAEKPTGQPTTEDDAKDKVVDEPEEKDLNVTAQTIDADLSDMLERLDSKTRRKLRRKLERGEATSTEIRLEATALLKPAKEEEEKAAALKSPQKGKKRKADWSNLPPEERVRREEQRKIQQEAAARREAGELPTSKFRHPLNSERRRANRRKPKWERPEAKTDGEPANQHHFSGFHMRKVQAASGGSDNNL